MDTDLPSISPSELARLIGRPDAPLLLDVRRLPKFSASEWLLPGARYCAPEDVPALAASEAPRDVVVYCVFGHNVSQDATRQLLEAGWNARYLQGGIEGGEDGVDPPAQLAAWRSEPAPRVRKPAGPA